MKGTWNELQISADQINLPGGVSWNYRAYPKTWNDSAQGNVTTAMRTIGIHNAFMGADVADQAYVVIAPYSIIDSMKTGRYNGLALRPNEGAMYWVAHLGHYISWGNPTPDGCADAINANPAKALGARMTLAASPNPFNTATTLAANLRGTDKRASLRIYNLKGQKVADFSSALKNSPTGKVVWTAGALPNGTYIIKLVSNREQFVKRVTLIK
jgi:hypothetical protein